MIRSGFILILVTGLAFYGQAQIKKQDSLALVSLYNSTNGAAWTDNTNWLTGSVNTWVGIDVDATGTRVVQVILPANGLSGTLPSLLDSLTALTDFNVSHNALTGTLPVMSKMTQLTNLDLSSNSFTGSLPSSLGAIPNLSFVDFSSNTFSGAIPASYGNLQNLGSFAAANNSLTALPQSFFLLSNLYSLDLSHNQIADSLRNSIYGWQAMSILDLSFNQFIGELPDSLFTLTTLTELRLNDNQFSEDIPVSIGRLKNLVVLHLHNNLLDCTIPSTLSKLKFAKDIDLSGNQFNHMDQIYFPGYGPNTFSVAKNKLQFGDIESQSYITAYSPQDSVNTNQIVTVIQGQPFTLTANVSGSANFYQWYFNGSALNGEKNYQYIKNSAVGGDAGVYYCSVTSDDISGITLYRKTIHVRILPCGAKINQTDSLALVTIYNTMGGASWKNKTNWLTGNVSSWYGVTTTCDRVTGLDLNNNNLTGTLSPSIGNLNVLTTLKLYGNSISGSLPSVIGNLNNLTSFSIGTAQLTGSLPPEIGNLTRLQYLYLDNNQLTGNLPVELENLNDLQEISLYNNKMTGSLESLCTFDLITYVNLANNQFSGTLPEGVTNLIHLQTLYLAHNQLTGTIPIGLDKMVNVQNFELRSNQFAGPIPSTLSSMQSLVYLALDDNQLVGSIPDDIGSGYYYPQNLQEFYVGKNKLTGTLPSTLDGLTYLQKFWFNDNQLTGSIPTNIGTINSLIEIVGRNNQFSGAIPDVFINLVNLSYLDFGHNFLEGTLPTSLNNDTSLTRIYFNDNQLSGDLPDYSSLINSTEISFQNNLLTGSIPTYLGSFSNLDYLTMGSNQFSGTIPVELGSAAKLGWIDLSNNQLTGSIPKEFGNLAQLGILFLNNNQLTGGLPTELSNCKNLGDLVVNNNQLTGTIPSSYSGFTKLYWVDLSYNNFTDSIPAWSGSTGLQYLFLSHNKFTFVPDFSGGPQLIGVFLDNNALTFESLEPYAKIKSKLTWGFTDAPQDSTGSKQTLLIQPQCPLTLKANVGGTANVYQWYKDGVAISGGTSSTYSVPATTGANVGSYTCNVTNTIATGVTITTRPILLQLSSALTVQINLSPGALCNAALLVVTPSGLSGYQWYQDGKKIVGATKDSLTVYYDGSYTVQYKPNQTTCQLVTPAFATTNLYSDNQPVIVANSTPATQLSTTTQATSYTWYINDKLIVDADSASIKVWYNGAYYLVVQLANGCQYRSNTLTVNESGYPILNRINGDGTTVSLSPPEEALSVYPNPAKGVVVISTGPLNANAIEVYDNAGQISFSKTFDRPENKIQLDISSWNSGMYIISILSDDKRIWQKLVKY
jgi:Leucine-rich repeat (LRR) protein